MWTGRPVVDGPVHAQSAALAALPEVEAGVLAAGVDEVEVDEELSDDDAVEDALSEAVEVLRLSVR